MTTPTGWQPIDTAPLWVEVVVKYDGGRCRLSQPNCIATAVRTEKGWDLGSFPKHRNILFWQHLPE